MAIREIELENDLNNYLEQFTDIKKHHSRSRTIRRPIGPCAKSGKPRPGSSRCSDSPTSGKRRSTPGQRPPPSGKPIPSHSSPGYCRRTTTASIKENQRIKTIKLPAGELQLRKAQPQYSRDDDKLTAWLKAHRPEFVRIKESPDWAKA